MTPTDEQRENRALYRLAREPEGLRTGQLYTLGTNKAAITRLADAGVIAVGTLGRWCITNAGRILVNSRNVTGRYSTVG
jgi:hypothetical protein